MNPSPNSQIDWTALEAHLNRYPADTPQSEEDWVRLEAAFSKGGWGHCGLIVAGASPEWVFVIARPFAGRCLCNTGE